MNFGLSKEISKEISKDIASKLDVFTEIFNNLNEFFSDKSYGESIDILTIGLICVGPEFESFFKPRYKYIKSKKVRVRHYYRPCIC